MTMRDPEKTIGHLIDKQSVSFSVLKFTASSGRFYSNFKSESFEIK